MVSENLVKNIQHMEVILNIIINITSKNGTVSSDYHQNAGQQCNRGKP